jgi:hypothetical protein
MKNIENRKNALDTPAAQRRATCTIFHMIKFNSMFTATSRGWNKARISPVKRTWSFHLFVALAKNICHTQIWARSMADKVSAIVLQGVVLRTGLHMSTRSTNVAVFVIGRS